jgi:CspA family cold shock protein
MENNRVMGTVQWFSRVKGYGFVRPDGQDEDVFVHYSVIQGEGYRNLNKGQRVELTVEDSPKGPQAVDVVGLDETVAVEEAAPVGETTPAEETTPVEETTPAEETTSVEEITSIEF